MEMNLAKVLAEEVPYHAHVYPKYFPIKGTSRDGELLIFYDECLEKEIGDEDEEAPNAQIIRAHDVHGKYDDHELSVFDHGRVSFHVDNVELIIRENGWAFKDFKIFYIWKISPNKELPSHCSVKFQPEINKFEGEVCLKKNENGISEAKSKFVNFSLHAEDCDKCLFVSDEGIEMNYSLLTKALRVEFEIRAYHKDGSPARNVHGSVRAMFLIGRSLYEEILFDGVNKHVELEHIADSAALMLHQSILIIPGDFWDFKLFISLNDNADKFTIERRSRILPRSIAVDEQYYIMGLEGYIIVTVKWACRCVTQGVCVCLSGKAVGDIDAFQANYYYDSSEDSEEDGESSQDENQAATFEEYRMKRAKMDDSTSQQTI